MKDRKRQPLLSGHRPARWAGILVLVALAAIAGAEGLLQIASLLPLGRHGSWRPGAANRILCVGDSHTYGVIVKREESYPAQLQQILDENEPGVHSVINLGIPGSNTTQLRHRIPDWLSRYQPDVLVVWSGINDAWNTAETEEQPGTFFAWLDHQLIRSRLYRLVRVRLHDRKLQHYTVKNDQDRRWQINWDRDRPPRQASTFTVRHDGVIETIPHVSDGVEDPDRIWPRAVADLTGIARYARASGARLIYVTYPLDYEPFDTANRAIWRVTEEFHVPRVDTSKSVQRVPEQDRKWLWAMHPGPALYREIARDVAAQVLNLPHRTSERGQ